jgi:hypothetical protein
VTPEEAETVLSKIDDLEIRWREAESDQRFSIYLELEDLMRENT